jgi:hypothetical protein
MVKLALVTLLLVLPSAAWPAPSPVRQHIALAMHLRAKHLLAKALLELQRAERASEGLADDVTLALTEGVILGEMGKVKEAETKFRSALALDAHARLTLRTTARVQQLFEGARAEAQRSPEAAPEPAKQAAEQPTAPAAPSAPNATPSAAEAAPSEAPANAQPAPRSASAPTSAPAPTPASAPTSASAPTTPAEPTPAPVEPAAQVAASSAPEPIPARAWPLAPIGLGVVAAGVGGMLIIDTLSGQNGQSPSRVSTFRTTGLALAGGGGVAILVGVIVRLLPVKASNAEVSFGVGPAGVSVAGTLP